jgi:uncharacterized protein YcfJ
MRNTKHNCKAKNLARWALPVLLAPSLTFATTVYDQARVLSSEPVYESVSVEVPVRECRDQQVAIPAHHAHSATVPIIGAIIGGALGNAVGHHKRNKQVGAVVGAVLGGSIGADISRRHHRQHSEAGTYRTERVCDVRNEVRHEERLKGYDVRYVYGGQTYATVMPHDPGDSVRVRVRVSPAE